MSAKVRKAFETFEDIDIIDRWLRELGQIDLSLYRGSPVGPLNPIDVSVAAIVLPAVDVTDRWNRQLGQIDIQRVLGAVLTPTNPVITGIYDAAGNRMPAMDAAARAGFVDVTDRVARLLGIAGRNWLLGALDIPDLMNRANRLLGIVYGNLAQLQQVPVTLELRTQDTGLNTNPELYIQTNKFSSVPIDRAGGVATLLYGAASPVAHRRTAGQSTTVWWIYFYNHSGGAATVWLEAPAGTVMSATAQLADNQGVMFNVKPLDIGDQDIYVNASVDNVQAQIGGIEV